MKFGRVPEQRDHERIDDLAASAAHWISGTPT